MLLSVSAASSGAAEAPCAPATGGGPVMRATMSAHACTQPDWVLATPADLRPRSVRAKTATPVATPTPAPAQTPAATVTRPAAKRRPATVRQHAHHVLRPHATLGRSHTAALPFVQPPESSARRVRGIVTFLLACALLFLGVGAIPRRVVPSAHVGSIVVARRVHLTAIGTAFLSVACALIVLAALGRV